MKKFLLNRIRNGEFDPSPNIQMTIDSLNKSYGRAKKTIHEMHSDDEVTFQESMTREFRYYSTEMQKVKLKQLEDEQKKMFQLKRELVDLFEIDIWDHVILNSEFNTLEELYETYKLSVREKLC